MLSKNSILDILSNPLMRLQDQPVEVQVFHMASIGHELNEIASWLDLSVQELETRYKDQLLKGRIHGFMEIRGAQHATAVVQNNATMLKHLGAHRLKQIDELLITQKTEQPQDLTVEELEARVKALLQKGTK